MRLFLDTNVLIDYLGQRRPFCDLWWKLEAMQLFGDAELWISSESFSDAFYLLSGAVGSEELQQAFLECLSFLNVASVDEDVIACAAQQDWSDFEDSVIEVCARRSGSDYLLTRDAKGFAKSSIPVYDLPGFFEYLENEYGLAYEDVEL